jgi:hypothetical protein
MFVELIVAAVVTATAPAALPPLDPVTPAREKQARKLLAPKVPPPPRDGVLPNGGRACLIIERCDPRPCILPAQRSLAPPARGRRCNPRRRPTPRVIPAATS